MNQTAFPTNKNNRIKIVAVIIATLFAATTSLLGVSAANAASGPYYNNCGAPSIKPTSITQYCADAGSGVTKIQWISWTAKSAKGYGTFYINSCDPNCASGKVYKTSVDVTLNSPAFTHGKKYLLRVWVAAATGKHFVWPPKDGVVPTTITWLANTFRG